MRVEHHHHILERGISRDDVHDRECGRDEYQDRGGRADLFERLKLPAADGAGG
jgi:hypothetical protein